jgi:hypothetical protein
MLVEEDECWFSRFVQPRLHSWAVGGEQLRLVQREPEQKEEQKAIACYGAVSQGNKEVFLYLCDGQPNSDYTIVMLKRLVGVARSKQKRVLVVIWDRATWHKSNKLKQWIRRHNLRAKQQRDVRLITYKLPAKSPWLNGMEPRWVHAKRKVCEPEGELTPLELKRRLCTHFQVELSTATLK